VVQFLPHELAIFRYNYRSVEYVRGLCKRQIIGYPLEVPMVFPLLLTDSREQERFPCHLQTQVFKMLPDAFVFSHAGGEGNLVKLSFRPNPRHCPRLERSCPQRVGSLQFRS